MINKLKKSSSPSKAQVNNSSKNPQAQPKPSNHVNGTSTKPVSVTNGKTKSLQSNSPSKKVTPVENKTNQPTSSTKKTANGIKPTSGSASSTSDKTQPKKRISSAAPNDKTKSETDQSQSSSKKQKLSLLDYKMLKGNTSESISKKSEDDQSQDDTLLDANDDEDFSYTTSNIYEEKSDSGDDSTKYTPTPLSKLSNNKTEDTKAEKILVPPLPLQPLGKNFLFETSSKQVNLEQSSKIQVTVPIPQPVKASNSRFRASSFPTFPGASNAVNKVNDRLADDEALAKIMLNKHSKRVLYTGKKQVNPFGNQPSKLYDICVKALINQLDELPNKISDYSKYYTFIM